jgi:organic radical activating enzyme
MNSILKLDYAEFYITNVCNLTCNGCNRFNSFRIKGWQAWSQYKSIYEKWSQQLNIGIISIMGGEPLLNPEFYQWVDGLSKLWPHSAIIIATNGTQLDRHKKFYDVMLDNKKISLNVSLHNKMQKKKIIDKVKNFLCFPFQYEADTTRYRESLSITDANGVTIKIFYNWWFHQGAIIRDQQIDRYTLHNSDPIKAHTICHSKTCHHFDQGRLYKCGPAALFQVFDQQIGLDLSDEDRKLMEHVNSLSVDDPLDVKRQFIDKIKEPIPQCKFCPENYEGKMIFAIEKKDL